jgi:phosphosulfolactate synthase
MNDTRAFLDRLGIAQLPPRSYPFDPGYDVATVESHLEQSHHLIAALKLSMATWMLIEPDALARKVRAARDRNVPVTAGGGMFEVALDSGCLDDYLDVCRRVGMTGIEAGQGFTRTGAEPGRVVAAAAHRGLSVSYEIGGKHDGPFDERVIADLVAEGGRWLDEGATHLVVEGRESAADVGLFDATGRLDVVLADTLAAELGLHRLVFEAPTKPSQFALLRHFGPAVALGNIRLEELLRVETFRHGLHSDAYVQRRAARIDLTASL